MKLRETILVVDDTETNIDLLLSFLSEEYDVSVATNGWDGIDLAFSITPDMILLDIVLPDIDGFQVCGCLKEDRRTSNIPIIFVTSLEKEMDEARGLDLGAVDYIVRPFSPELVKARIKNHLELERHRHKLEELVAEKTRNLKATQFAALQCMAMLAEARDPGTGAHVQRTGKYVTIIAEHLRFHRIMGREVSSEDVETLAQASPLHDVGKIGVPDRLLLKPGKLTEEEFDEIKNHASYGAEILKQAGRELGAIPFLMMAEVIAQNHHERWDGHGYPRGLKGEEIPLPARIMAIADVYDALRSERPYKKAFSHEKAKKIILAESGSHFDPVLVEVFLAVEGEFESIAKKHR
nr:HD domain-containing phosphohydrolase [uncultured Dethiosulfovibrio sp.]